MSITFIVSTCNSVSSVACSFLSSTYTSNRSSSRIRPNDILSASLCLSRTSTAIFFCTSSPTKKDDQSDRESQGGPPARWNRVEEPVPDHIGLMFVLRSSSPGQDRGPNGI